MPLRRLPGAVRRRVAPVVSPPTPAAAAAEVGERPDGLPERLLDSAEGPVLVLAAEPDVVAELPGDDPADLRVVRLWERAATGAVDDIAEPEGGWRSVVFVARDREGLRTAVSVLPDVGTTRVLGVWLTAAPEPVLVTPTGNWPGVGELQAQRLTGPDRGACTGVWFSRSVRARTLLRAVAAQSVRSADTAPGLLVVGYAGRGPLPGLDLGAVPLGGIADAVDPDRVVPPDVVVAAAGTEAAAPGTHPVLARPPLVVTDPGVEPVDELLWNPIGFRKTPDRRSAAVPQIGVTERFLRRARRSRTVAVDVATTPTSDVLRLAMAGVALEVTGTQPRFAPAVQKALAAPYDPDDLLAREVWTVRLRRAVFDHHSTLAWRAGAAAHVGLDRVRSATSGLPAVSVLLVTKRAHELEDAVRTVAAQVGVEIELVVATHGFTADAGAVKDWLGREATVLSLPADMLFGDALTAAAEAASCSVVMKMDDDDWYSPHAVHDLLMARRFSGAEVVGMPAEFVHLGMRGIDETVRRSHPVERYVDFVAGGTLTLSRDLLREVGGFRSTRRWVDTQLLHAVRAVGGQIYRTHGLGYVLRRRADGHTWHQDPDDFRQPDIVDRTWPGFRPPEDES